MSLPVSLFLIAVLLFSLEYSYIHFARQRGLVERKNLRSSHTDENVVLGGGFIFPLAILLSGLCGFNGPWVLGAVALVGVVSMADDFHPLPDWLRLLVQIAAMVMVCLQFGFGNPWMWVIAILLGVAVMNAFNFMDGINGMTVFYSAVVLLALSVSCYMLSQSSLLLCLFTFVPLAVFGFFNCRSRALCFAGDVGAVTLGLIVAVNMLIFLPGKPSATVSFSLIAVLLSFVLVYGVDTGLTLLLRIIKGENVRAAHRSHLFQLLVNEAGYRPLVVSGAYAGVQLLVDVVMFFCIFFDVVVPGFIGLTVLLCADYFYIRKRIVGVKS